MKARRGYAIAAAALVATNVGEDDGKVRVRMIMIIL